MTTASERVVPQAPASQRSGFVSSVQCLAHDPGAAHPERAERLLAIAERLRTCGQWSELEHLAATPAERNVLTAIHPNTYLERCERRIRGGAQFVDTADANVSSASWDAALCAAGGTLQAVERVTRGNWRNAFVAVRPPGHHAEENLAMGFCLLNNVAIAARYLQRVHGVERIAIVDWDVHHGNGTQHIFERDPSVFYASLHEYPHYPGTGKASERGLGAGLGTTLNCPQVAHSGERDWLSALERQILPALADFRPDFLLISAGFDAHRDDPLSSIELDDSSYAKMSELLLACAAEHCAGRVVSVLEGGYDLAALARSVEAHIGALLLAPQPTL